MAWLRIALVRFTEWTIVLLGGAFSVIVIYAVFSRYVFGFSLTWIEEIVRFLLAWIVFLGLSVVLHYRGHMAMQAIFLSLPQRLQGPLLLVLDILILIFLAVVVYAGTELALSAVNQRSPVTGVSFFWPYLSLPVGAALGVVQAFFLIIDDIKQSIRWR